MEKIPDISPLPEDINLTLVKNEPLPKRPLGTDRFIGLTEEEEVDKRFLRQEIILSEQVLAEHERPKSLEEIKLIAEIFKRVPEFIKEYGAETHKVFPIDSVHLLDYDSLEDERVKTYLENGINGKYMHVGERIDIVVTKENFLNLAKTLIHEVIHANSFFSEEIDEVKDGPEKNTPFKSTRQRRLGLISMLKDKYPMFMYMNEALTEELTKRFCDKYFNSIKQLQDSYETNNSLKFQNFSRKNAPAWDVILEKLDDGEGYSYLNERIDFVSLAFTIYEKNKDIFEEYEDVIKMFSKAMFTGKILDLSRVIEGTFGKGAFRKLGIHYLSPSQDVTPEQIITWLREEKTA